MEFHADYWEAKTGDPLEHCYDDRNLERVEAEPLTNIEGEGAV